MYHIQRVFTRFKARTRSLNTLSILNVTRTRCNSM